MALRNSLEKLLKDYERRLNRIEHRARGKVYENRDMVAVLAVSDIISPTIPTYVLQTSLVYFNGVTYTWELWAALIMSKSALEVDLGMSSPQSLASSTTAAILSYDVEVMPDERGWHSSATRVTPTVPGRYVASLAASWSVDTDYTRLMVGIRRNGTEFVPPVRDDVTGTGMTRRTVTLVTPPFFLDGKSQYVDSIGLQTNASGHANTVDARLSVRLVKAT